MQRITRLPSAVAARCYSSAIPHSDLSYRALLRNLRLLGGMRAGKTKFEVVITGLASSEVAEQLGRMDPSLNIRLLGSDTHADLDGIAKLKGQAIDAIVITQPYHVLRGKSDVQLMKAALDVEEGSIGFLWNRMIPEGALASANFSAVPRLTGLGDALKPGDSPMSWIESLNVPGLKPFKHRKFVEKRTLSADALTALLVNTHDGRFSDPVAAAVALRAIGVPQLSCSWDLHAFHTSVVPATPVPAAKTKE